MAKGDTPSELPAQSTSASRLQKAKVNLAYLALGSKAGVAPASIATRSALTTTRYVLRYAIRRIIRYAKYAAAGAIVAALGATLMGTLGSGLAFFAAPGIAGGMGLGLATAVVKFGWRHRGNYLRGGAWANMKARAQAGHSPIQDERMDAKGKEEARKAENKQRRADVWMRS